MISKCIRLDSAARHVVPDRRLARRSATMERMPTDRTHSRAFVWWAGIAGMLGGTLWIASTVIHALKPVGCVAEECAIRPMRESSAIEGVLTLGAIVLFSVAAAGLILVVRRAGRFGRLGQTGAVLSLLGVGLVVVASLVQAVLFEGDFPLMPYFVIPGLLALIVGFILVGVTVLLAGVLPLWTAGALLVGTLVMAGFNEQTHAAWLALPFGVAWIPVGYSMWRKADAGKPR